MLLVLTCRLCPSGHSLNVVSFLEAFEDDTSVHIAMERCTGGTLWHSRALVDGRFNEQAAAEVMRAVLRTVAQCHAHDVVFRDIKPENYLLSSPEAGAALKLSDFGLAARCRPGQVLTERCGTLAYMAPEVVSQRYEQAADLWSAGVMCFQLLSGRLPFTAGEEDGERTRTKELFRAILFEKPDMESPPWDTISPAAKDFVGRLIGHKDPRERMGVHAALEHAWVREQGGLARSGPLDGTVVARLQRFGTAGALQRAVLRAVAASASGDGAAATGELAAVESLFDALDVERTGALPRDVLIDGLRAQGYQLSPAEWGQLLQELDPGASGRVSRAHFLAALLDWRRVATTEPRWEEWAQQAFTSFGGQEDVAPGVPPPGIPAALLLDEVCDVSWEHQGAAVCRDAVADALRESAHEGLISFEAWRQLLAHAGPDEALSEFDARLG